MPVRVIGGTVSDSGLRTLNLGSDDGGRFVHFPLMPRAETGKIIVSFKVWDRSEIKAEGPIRPTISVGGEVVPLLEISVEVEKDPRCRAV